MPAILFCTSPDWSKDAVWYQIFTDRFYNGDPANDPTTESLYGTWPWVNLEKWAVSPWRSDWYKLQPWETANGLSYHAQFQLRRYGGDLQGILDRLDYLQELGVNALYLNPVFESPSNHKYGAALYHHIDRHFGPDPEGDAAIIATEDPSDPTTWKWTSADSLFLKLVDELHRREMHIIIDGVFNHAGLTFWAFEDVISQRESSPFWSWYAIEGSGYPDQSHINDYRTLPDFFLEEGQKPFRYKGFVEDLPSFRQDENGIVGPVAEHFHNVVKRWMDPDGNGDPSDGIDGWRLDVAERVQMPFWETFNSWLEEINPEAYTTGEVWWEDWKNNIQFNAEPWLRPGRMNSVMNYRFGDAMFKFFIDKKRQINATKLDRLLGDVRNSYPHENNYYLQNMVSSHDMERLSSAILNPDRAIDHDGHWRQGFDVAKPGREERRIQETILAFQFVYVGTPMIYYGDEVGLWGGDDPDCRKPMLWPDMVFDNEKAHPCDYVPDCDDRRPSDRVRIDKELLAFYKVLTSFRHQYPSLRRGSFKTIHIDDNKRLFAFERELDGEKVVAVFNGSDRPVKTPSILIDILDENKWQILLGGDSWREIPAKGVKVYANR